MDNTIKLIIEIPKIDKELLDTGLCGELRKEAILYAVKNATPLEDVKAEIADIPAFEYETHKIRTRVLEILDNIGKAESEDKE